VTAFDASAIETAARTDVGRQRATNQDACACGVSPSGARLLVVADGMGGHAGGATASRLAVETVERLVGSSTEAPDAMLRHALEEANRCIYERSREDASVAGMGTTGVALLIGADGTSYVANVGDSRAYRLRDRELEQLTVDHSLVAELQRRGMLSEAQARVHPRRNEVLRSLGVEPSVEVDVFAVDVKPGDQYLLCSDGLSGVVGDAEIASVMGADPPEVATRRLVDAANARGGPDNITVLIARIPGPASSPPDTGGGSESAGRGHHGRLAFLLLAAGLFASTLLWSLLRE
jgi:protein phosphatase